MNRRSGTPKPGSWDDRMANRIATHVWRWFAATEVVTVGLALGLTTILRRPFAETMAWLTCGFLFGVILLAAAMITLSRGRNLIREAHEVDDLRALTWRGFEEIVAAAYRRQGWIVHPTNEATDADGGADLILEKRRRRMLVQCKQWRERSVGVDVVRALRGVMAASKVKAGAVVSCGSFSREAVAFAEKNGITLVNGGALLRMIRGVTEADDGDAIDGASTIAPTVGPPCTRCKGSTHLVAKTLAESSYYGCDRYPDCWCRIPVAG